jgi:hypothetical protein
MHWRWLTDTLTILLTAAIAWAGWRQAVTAEKQDATAKNLLKLQQTIEEQRNKIWVFLRVKPYFIHGHTTAVVEIANLSQVGIWLEKLIIHLDDASAAVPDRAHSEVLEKVLGSLGTTDIDIQAAANVVGDIQPGQERQITIWVEVEFWANGEWRHTPRTPRYSMKTSMIQVRDLKMEG